MLAKESARVKGAYRLDNARCSTEDRCALKKVQELKEHIGWIMQGAAQNIDVS